MNGIHLDPEEREVRALRRLTSFAGATVLDVGCGDGRLSRRVAHDAACLVGIDPETVAIEYARRGVQPSMEGRSFFGVASGMSLPFRAGVFDIAVLSWSL